MKISNTSPDLSFKMNYKVQALKNVNKDFTKAVTKSIKHIPNKWGEVLQNNNYKLYCSNSIADIFENEKLGRDAAPEWESVTCTHPLYKFFAITTRVEPKDIQKIVNHEISHGIIDAEKLMTNADLVEALSWDTYKLPNRHPDNNNYDLYETSNFLFKPLSEYNQNEICADLLAWLQPGGGLWGSGYKNTLKNPSFLKENFPETFKFLSSYKVGQSKNI